MPGVPPSVLIADANTRREDVSGTLVDEQACVRRREFSSDRIACSQADVQ